MFDRLYGWVVGVLVVALSVTGGSYLPDGVTKVRFTIESAYGASASKQVAIAEIEFFGRSGSNHS